MPATSAVPAAGVYPKLPARLTPPTPVAVALSCAAPSGVPAVIGAGAVQVMVGVAGRIVSVPNALGAW